MTARSDLAAQIADDLMRSDLSTQIETAIDYAVRAYERDRFWFNEAKGVTVTLSVSTSFIDLSAFPYTFFDFDIVRLPLSGNTYSELLPRDAGLVMTWQMDGLVARPSEYCIYANAMHFDSVADASYALLVDGVRSLYVSATASATNIAWFTDARDLIRARAKKDLFMHVIMDTPPAQTAAMHAAEDMAYRFLKGRTNRLKSTGHLRPTCW